MTRESSGIPIRRTARALLVATGVALAALGLPATAGAATPGPAAATPTTPGPTSISPTSISPTPPRPTPPRPTPPDPTSPSPTPPSPTPPRPTPPIIPEPEVASVSGGVQHTCAITRQGMLWCWGTNAMGQLGDGTLQARTTPTRVSADTDWIQVNAGMYHTCAIKKDSSLWCWGANWLGQVGDGGTTNRLTPVRVAPGTSWTSVDAGGFHTCGTQQDGTLHCWGYNGHGQLGTGSIDDHQSVPVPVTGGRQWSTVSAGDWHTCAIDKTLTLYCWGVSEHGRLGAGEGLPAQVPTPTRVAVEADWSGVSAAGMHTCATAQGGSLWCWGNNHDGQLGDGTVDNRATPVQVPANIRWALVTATGWHTCGVNALDGGLWCWGYNASGQLGDGSTANRPTPGPVEAASTWIAASAGGFHTCAVKKDATLYCWGRGSDWQLGNGSTVDRPWPKRVLLAGQP